MQRQHRKLAPFAIAALMLCLPLAAQGQADEPPVVKEPQEADIYPGLRGNGVDEQTVRDMQIKSQIDDAIANEQALDRASIDVQVENGVVHLSGEARDEDARQLAGRIARDMQYVSKVKNELKIAKPE